MPSIWARDFAFAREATGQPIVLGEMGGSYVGADRAWQDWALPYMVASGFSVFYFALNPASDTGGLLADDWSVPAAGSAEAAKLAALEQLPSTDVFDVCPACSAVSIAPSLPLPFIAPREALSSVVPPKLTAVPPVEPDLHPPSLLPSPPAPAKPDFMPPKLAPPQTMAFSSSSSLARPEQWLGGISSFPSYGSVILLAVILLAVVKLLYCTLFAALMTASSTRGRHRSKLFEELNSSLSRLTQKLDSARVPTTAPEEPPMATAARVAPSPVQPTREQELRGSAEPDDDWLEEHADQFYVGARVKVGGLANERQFNGALGEVVGYIQTERGLRLGVHCDSGDRVCTRIENLKLLGAEGAVHSI